MSYDYTEYSHIGDRGPICWHLPSIMTDHLKWAFVFVTRNQHILKLTHIIDLKSGIIMYRAYNDMLTYNLQIHFEISNCRRHIQSFQQTLYVQLKTTFYILLWCTILEFFRRQLENVQHSIFV